MTTVSQNVVRDGIRLSVGTFTAIAIKAPQRVDRDTARIALLIAPIAVLPIGVLVGVVAWLGHLAALPNIVTGALAVAAGALGNRAFHLDGLADTVDALSASYDRDRALAIARTGDVGPAGATALVLTLLVQAGSVGALAATTWGPALVALCWCAARAAASVGLRRGVRPARDDGLGRTFAESVPVAAALAQWLLIAGAFTAVLSLLGSNVFAGPAVVAVTALAVLLLIGHVTNRLGGIIGDAVGACVEVAFAALLVLSVAAL
ncbi:MAG TPA: adenosylcobinamide-GDP ribazoletransferase [Aeromicrobium sp.]|nr:adenosylcobinamide-GDP ribazoletransferase [Aeromicrobium sp.]